MTQKAKLLEVIRTRKKVSNFELHEAFPNIFQIPARIWELIHKEGQPIIGYQDQQDPRKHWYEWVEPKKDLFIA